MMDQDEPEKDLVKKQGSQSTTENKRRFLPLTSSKSSLFSGVETPTKGWDLRKLSRQISDIEGMYLNNVLDVMKKISREGESSQDRYLGTIEKLRNEAQSEINEIVSGYIAPFLIDKTNLLYKKASALENEAKQVEKFIEKVYISNKHLIERSISNQKRSLSHESIMSRFLMLEEHARLHGGEGLADYAANLLADVISDPKQLTEPLGVGESSIPSQPPELWKEGRRADETPPSFIQRVYGDWLGKGLTTADIRRLDESLSRALYHHIRHGKPIPEDFDLPKKAEQNDRWVQKVEREGTSALADGQTGEGTLKEYFRYQSARNRRRTGQPESDR